MTKRLLGTVVLLALGAVLLLSSCGGGSKRLTKEELAVKMNALCAVFNKKVDAVGEPTTIQGAIASLNKLLPVYEKILADMESLKPPADNEADMKQIVSLGNKQVDGVNAMIDALKKNDMATFNKLGNESDASDKKTDPLFNKMGATECSKD
jgi:hypothetical protein